jgi:hypothetical protein
LPGTSVREPYLKSLAQAPFSAAQHFWHITCAAGHGVRRCGVCVAELADVTEEQRRSEVALDVRLQHFRMSCAFKGTPLSHGLTVARMLSPADWHVLLYYGAHPTEAR